MQESNNCRPSPTAQSNSSPFSTFFSSSSSSATSLASLTSFSSTSSSSSGPFFSFCHPSPSFPLSSSSSSLYSSSSSSFLSSATSSSPVFSSAEPFVFSCNTAFHPLQLSSLLPNPLPPLQPSSSYSTSASSSSSEPLLLSGHPSPVLLVFFLFCIHPVRHITLFIFLLFLLLLCNLFGFFNLFTLCILHFILCNILLVLPIPFTLLHLILRFCILHVFFFLFPPLPPYSLSLHSSSPPSFIFFLLSPLPSLFRKFPLSSPS